MCVCVCVCMCVCVGEGWVGGSMFPQTVASENTDVGTLHLQICPRSSSCYVLLCCSSLTSECVCVCV